mgnify:FL=1
MKKVALFLMTVLFLAGVLPAFAFAGEIQQKLTGESTLEQVLKRKVLKVGMSTFVPWAMKDKTARGI